MTEKIRDIINDILREMYSEAEPGLDFDEVLENPDEYGDGWYSDHYLDGDRQIEILEKHCSEHSLTRAERTSVNMTAVVSLGPSSTKNE